MKLTDLAPLAEALRDFYFRANHVLDSRMRSEGLSLARAKLLHYVAKAGPVRSADVVAWFGHSPRTVTEGIDGLERAGLVRRDPDPDDRRVKWVSITPPGQISLAKSEAPRARFLEDVFGPLDTGEREALAAILGKMNLLLKNLDEA